MADSKSQKKNDNKPVVKKPNKIQKWWRETIGELRKVTWPTKEEALKMTKIGRTKRNNACGDVIFGRNSIFCCKQFEKVVYYSWIRVPILW